MNKNDKLDRHNKVDWVAVYVTHNVNEAHIVAGRLESAGIPNMIHSQPGASAMGITIGNMGRIDVLVTPDDYEEAISIIREPDDPELPDKTDRYIHGLDDDETE